MKLEALIQEPSICYDVGFSDVDVSSYSNKELAQVFKDNSDIAKLAGRDLPDLQFADFKEAIVEGVLSDEYSSVEAVLSWPEERSKPHWEEMAAVISRFPMLSSIAGCDSSDEFFNKYNSDLVDAIRKDPEASWEATATWKEDRLKPFIQVGAGVVNSDQYSVMALQSWPDYLFEVHQDALVKRVASDALSLAQVGSEFAVVNGVNKKAVSDERFNEISPKLVEEAMKNDYSFFYVASFWRDDRFAKYAPQFAEKIVSNPEDRKRVLHELVRISGTKPQQNMMAVVAAHPETLDEFEDKAVVDVDKHFLVIPGALGTLDHSVMMDYESDKFKVPAMERVPDVFHTTVINQIALEKLEDAPIKFAQAIASKLKDPAVAYRVGHSWSDEHFEAAGKTLVSKLTDPVYSSLALLDWKQDRVMAHFDELTLVAGVTPSFRLSYQRIDEESRKNWRRFTEVLGPRKIEEVQPSVFYELENVYEFSEELGLSNQFYQEMVQSAGKMTPWMGQVQQAELKYRTIDSSYRELWLELARVDVPALSSLQDDIFYQVAYAYHFTKKCDSGNKEVFLDEFSMLLKGEDSEFLRKQDLAAAAYGASEDKNSWAEIGSHVGYHSLSLLSKEDTNSVLGAYALAQELNQSDLFYSELKESLANGSLSESFSIYDIIQQREVEPRYKETWITFVKQTSELVKLSQLPLSNVYLAAEAYERARENNMVDDFFNGLNTSLADGSVEPWSKTIIDHFKKNTIGGGNYREVQI